MPTAQRRASVVWEGNLVKGKGTFSVGSGAMENLSVTFAARTERSDGKTSPEELLAAAHATCFSMALSNRLTEMGTPPARLEVTAVCTLDRVEGHLKITAMDLEVRGQVPGSDQASFEKATGEAAEGCPVSKALRGNLEIRHTARLEA